MKLLVTAGPTREPIDPVRYLSNRSSGKMGYAIVQAALDAGHGVALISGPVALAPPPGAQTIPVTTAEQMYEAVHCWVAWADVCVLCAAVADFRPATVETEKIKKGTRDRLVLELIPTRDILLSLRGLHGRVVGFAAETNDVLAHARRKLHEKGCALVGANDVSREGIGFEGDENAVTLLFASGETREVPQMSKTLLAARLIEIFGTL